MGILASLSNGLGKIPECWYVSLWPLGNISRHSWSIYYWLGTDLFDAINLQKYFISQNVIFMTDSNLPGK